MTITNEQKVAEFLKGITLSKGVGTVDNPCSVAAINLALTGVLTDGIPECMSTVIGHWVIKVQDRMSNTLRNSKEWKALLPLATGTGRDTEKEKQRLDIVMEAVWAQLPTLQKRADHGGYGEEWATMLSEKTDDAFLDAAIAADRDIDDHHTRLVAMTARAAVLAVAYNDASEGSEGLYAAYNSAADAHAYSAADDKFSILKTFKELIEV